MMDKTLRNQGMKAEAITIDCIALDKKIVILIHDDKPDVVCIALGNKEGELYFMIDLVKFDNLFKRLKVHFTKFPPLCLKRFLSVFFTSQVPL